MSSVAEENKPLKGTKIHKKIKLPKLYKVIKPSKIIKLFKPLFKLLSPRPSLPKQPLPPEEQSFMACRIKVDPTKQGWHKAIWKILRHCKLEARFLMDQDGVVELSGIGDPDQLLRRLGKTKGIEIRRFQYGQCSNQLFIPVQKKPNAPNPISNSLPPNRAYGYPHQSSSYAGYGYGYGSYPNGPY